MYLAPVGAKSLLVFAWGHCGLITDQIVYTYDLEPVKHNGVLSKKMIFSLFKHCENTNKASLFHVYSVLMPSIEEVEATKIGGVSSYKGMAVSEKWRNVKQAVLDLQKESIV